MLLRRPEASVPGTRLRATCAHMYHSQCAILDHFFFTPPGVTAGLGVLRIVKLHSSELLLHCFSCGHPWRMHSLSPVREDDQIKVTSVIFDCRACNMSGGGLYMADLVGGFSDYALAIGGPC